MLRLFVPLAALVLAATAQSAVAGQNPPPQIPKPDFTPRPPPPNPFPNPPPPPPPAPKPIPLPTRPGGMPIPHT